jgi:hypothetical protein
MNCPHCNKPIEHEIATLIRDLRARIKVLERDLEEAPPNRGDIDGRD